MSVIEHIEFDAGGTTLRGWFIAPKNATNPFPTVIMAHGFSALKEMGLDRYAAKFNNAGLACLIYDNRNIGTSDGEPRQEIDPVMQMRDYRHAVTYAISRDDVNSELIGVWGTSYSGGLVLNAAATDRRIKCVVSQVPYLHGIRTGAQTNTPEALAELLDLIDEERVRLGAGYPPRTVPICSFDPDAGPETPGNRTHQFFHAFNKNHNINWPNEITIRSLELRREYDSLSFVPFVAPTPLLMIVADDDEITPTDLALEAFAQASEPKSLHIIKGDHYRPYFEAFDEASDAAAAWLAKHLCV